MITSLKNAVIDGWKWQASVFLAGALLPLSFAPINFWPASIICLTILAFCLYKLTPKQSAACGFLFSLGMFLSGVHWLFVPIYQFSSTPAVFAVLLVLLFSFAVATVYFALPFFIFGRWCNKNAIGLWLGLPAIWVITEWLRTWLFTGFPWLFLGYSHLNTWLSGWAPISGVLGLSFIVAFSASTIIFCWLKRDKPIQAGCALILCLSFWGLGFILKPVQWTENFGQPVTVGLAQGNIPQELKWEPSFLQPTLDRYQTLTNKLIHNDWVVWPEAAIPLLANSRRDQSTLTPLFENLKRQAIENNSALITGILTLSPDTGKAYNSIVATGLGSGIYYKQRLVPFGEYAPLEEWLGGLFNFFNIQRSMVAKGPSGQRGLQIGGALLAPSICYEIVYPDLVAQGANNNHALITISNDAWFGKSIGPLQHMQMAQMRALETQRFVIRGTNNGVSALVNEKGEIIAKTNRYVIDSVEGEVTLKQGSTPFMAYGSEPIVFISLLIIGIIGFTNRKKKINNP